ncbi:hypothetical protein [Streptomyces pilosus]|uniref:hypothetical protein n=1 Tax=Streptomyces pilosus TaxID=28893 RepID=UPI001674D39A|nr:hypothetical protein [Streptomyces pilosus]
MSQATYLRTQDVRLGELTPYPGNARRGDVRLILESLRSGGQYRSLIARQTPDGHLAVLVDNRSDVRDVLCAVAGVVDVAEGAEQLGQAGVVVRAQLRRCPTRNKNQSPQSARQAAARDGGDLDTGNPEVFNPVIKLRLPYGTFDRWHNALDAHPGEDDTDKLLGLLDEVEQHRAEAAA